MRKLTIPVHPLSARIIGAEYGESPILVGPNDLLFNMLCMAHSDSTAPALSERLLTGSISIWVSNPLIASLEARMALSGLYLFRYHKDLMCRHILLSKQNDHSALGAIKTFLDYYDVDDLEYSIESAYKCWQRYQKKSEEKNPQNVAKKLPMLSYKMATFRPSKKPLPKKELDALHARFFDCVTACLKSTPKTFRKHSRCYIYRTFGHYTDAQTGSELNIPPRTVNYAAGKIADWVSTDTTLRRLLENIAP